jgi:hypothetical protein
MAQLPQQPQMQYHQHQPHQHSAHQLDSVPYHGPEQPTPLETVSPEMMESHSSPSWPDGYIPASLAPEAPLVRLPVDFYLQPGTQNVSSQLRAETDAVWTRLQVSLVTGRIS